MSAVLNTHTVLWYLENSQELSAVARTSLLKVRPSSPRQHGTITIRGRIRCNVASNVNRDFGDVPVGRQRADGDAVGAGAPPQRGVSGRAGPAGLAVAHARGGYAEPGKEGKERSAAQPGIAPRADPVRLGGVRACREAAAGGESRPVREGGPADK